ncbi:TetR family transcriptional regulator [Streptomyces sp. 1114.5]|uniref:TetR/AcrR family transcriptional regulator n=1 Tax=Streptomyces sp. 1114.5 TaxID=1938830 RepID=UPI000EAE9B6F|nr:TetR/AcrR family transcriptional regulator [Streptomyces sp. 1114.5]RKT17146.1 TetR family transcriptional regulator [Streptomyces sp. 1114.5]
MVVRRPPGRRAQILAVAAELFHRSGYHQVSMSEVAAGVGITAPALYRHFRGKPELLDHVVRLGLDALAEGLRTARTTGEIGAALAAVAVGHRPLGTLVQRDARLLPPARRAALRRELRADVTLMATALRAERHELTAADAELLCWSALSACAGLSYQSAAPQPRRAEALLRELVAAVLAVPLSGPAAGHPAPAPAPAPVTASAPASVTAPAPAPAAAPEARPQARREELLAAAVRLFHQRGFDNVSTDRLGAAVGISGPSVYRHFDSKAQLLAASLVRSRERLWHEVDGAIAAADGPEAALAAGLGAYVGFALRNGDYLGAMLSETERLAPPDRRAALDFRRDFLRTWVGLLRQVRPECDAAAARIRVHALFALVNDGVRNRPHSARPDLGECLLRLGRAVLGLS